LMKIKELISILVGIVCLISSGNVSFGQSPIWTFSNQYYDFNTMTSLPIGPDLTFDYQGQPAEFASNAYHNPVTGKLLFFVVDGKVYDHEGYCIGEMIAKSGLSSAVCTGSEEIAIFPDP